MKRQAYTFSGWNGPPCPSLGEHFSKDGELCLNGGMEEREGEWLEIKRVSRHSHGKRNDKEMRSDLRVTPTPLFILFLGIFRVLSLWLGL